VPTVRYTDAQVERLLGNLLRTGVILAGAVVAVGGVLYLARHGMEAPAYGVFHEESSRLRTLRGIASGMLALRGRGVIQFGILLLIGTPIARVALSVYGFVRERDYVYVGITLFVLALLLMSLFGQMRPA
jgi:uncharacterized membrane protein